MSVVALPGEAVDLWWGAIAELDPSSPGTRESSIALRREQAWAACEAVVLAYDERGGLVRPSRGRPLVAGLELELSFSYGAASVGVAASGGRAIGLDVESLGRRVDVEAVARHALTPGERETLDDPAVTDPTATLVRMWVRKEAVLKAAGAGLRIEPSEVDVGATDGPRLVLVPGVGDFTVVEVPRAGHACAVAAAGAEPLDVRTWRDVP